MSEQDRYLSTSELVQKARTPGSVQLRISDPSRLMGGAVLLSGDDYLGWLAGQSDSIPSWGVPVSRAKYLDLMWRNDSRLAGTIFTLVSRMVSTGWTLSGPADAIEKWYDVFAGADEGWTMFVKLLYTDYLTCDEGGVFETTRRRYPYGEVVKLWNMDSKRTVPGPITIHDQTWPLLFQDQDSWKGMKKGQFHRIVSMPTTDQFFRRIGFCFMSRVFRYARLYDLLLQYQEERVENLPPQGVATVAGLTKTQVDNAFTEFRLAQERKQTKVWPGILWFIANTFGQEASVAFTSFREVWSNFSDREAHEIFMKIIALDAGLDVGALWQVEFHGATKAASWIQHTKARGKGPAEFVADFERWAARMMRADGVVFVFDAPDDEQDLLEEQIRKARIDNILSLITPYGSEGPGLLTREQGLELAAEWRAIPQRYAGPAEVRVATDVFKARSTHGTVHWPEGDIIVHRSYWSLSPETKQLTNGMTDELAQKLVPIIKRWQVLTVLFSDLLGKWEDDLLLWLRTEQAVLENAGYWTAWSDKIQDAVMDEYLVSASQGGLSLGLDVSFDRINEVTRAVAEQQAFDLVKLDGEESIVRSRRDFIDKVREELATGKLPWSDLEKRLEPFFGTARSKLISISENTSLWASGQLATAKFAEMKEKRSVRADEGRPCPSKVCPVNTEKNWIPIDDDFPSGHQSPSYHPGCYCFIQVR